MWLLATIGLESRTRGTLNGHVLLTPSFRGGGLGWGGVGRGWRSTRIGLSGLRKILGMRFVLRRKRPYKAAYPWPMSCPDLRRGAEGCVLGEGSDARAPPDKSS